MAGQNANRVAPSENLSPSEMGPTGGVVALSGLVAAVVACGVPLVQGLFVGWSALHLGGYAVFAVGYVLLVWSASRNAAGSGWSVGHTWQYLSLAGLLAFGLQALSGDPFIQPIVFTIPLVHATLAYPPRVVAGVAIAYLLLMGAGLWIGSHSLLGALLSVPAYGALMVFMFAFTRLSVEQSAARAQADRLAADLARERDAMARLAASTATLTSDLRLQQVLSQIATTGRDLADADAALVWLVGEKETDAPFVLRAAMPTALAAIQSAYPANLSGDARVLALPLVANAATLGLLELRRATPFAEHDLRMLQPFVAAAAIAIDNARLFEQAQQSATLAERNRLARELHDTIAQGLTAVAMQLEAAQRSFARDGERTLTRLNRAHTLARETLNDVRRSVWTLAEPLVDGADLLATLDTLAEQFAARTGTPAEREHHGPAPTVGAAAATQVARIVREALQNVEKHANASNVMLLSEVRDGALHVAVRDDGVGFAVDAPVADGFGLTSLRERARLAGGTLTVKSAPGSGTTVAIAVPLAKT